MADDPKVTINKKGFTIKWDQDSDRTYEAGTDMAAFYIKGDNGNDTKTEYGAATAWNGITSVNETSEGGEPNDIYADDMKYLSIPGNENSGFTVEAYTYPDAFCVCDGSMELGGAHIHQQRRKKFGFVYRSKIGDENDTEKGYKFHIYWNCLAAPSERSYQTINENPEAMSMSWSVTTTAQDIGVIKDSNNVEHAFRPAAHVTIDTTKFTTSPAITRLESVLNMLYGDGTEAGYLPPIETVIRTLGGFPDPSEQVEEEQTPGNGG